MSITFYAHRAPAARPVHTGPNFNNANALAVLGACAVRTDEWGGECSRAALEAGIMRAEGALTIARATGHMGRLSRVLRMTEAGHNFLAVGLDIGGLELRIETLRAFAERAAELGAEWVTWS